MVCKKKLIKQVTQRVNKKYKIKITMKITLGYFFWFLCIISTILLKSIKSMKNKNKNEA